MYDLGKVAALLCLSFPVSEKGNGLSGLEFLSLYGSSLLPSSLGRPSSQACPSSGMVSPVAGSEAMLWQGWGRGAEWPRAEFWPHVHVGIYTSRSVCPTTFC